MPTLQPGELQNHDDKEVGECCRIKLSRMDQHNADHSSMVRRGTEIETHESTNNPSYYFKIARNTLFPSHLPLSKGLAQEH